MTNKKHTTKKFITPDQLALSLKEWGYKNNLSAPSDFMHNAMEAKRADTENNGRNSTSAAGAKGKKSVGKFGLGVSSKGCFSLAAAKDLGFVQPLTVHLGETDD